MRQTITISIEASSTDTDAPTVSDLLSQLGDYSDLLGILEGTIAEDGQSAIQWRVVNAAKASPLAITLQAFARQYAVNVDTRANLVIGHVAIGLDQLSNSAVRPKYFTDEAVAKAERIFERVTNGLGKTIIDAGADYPIIQLTPTVARVAAKNAQTVLAPVFRPYKEVGSVEGYFESVSLDGWGHRLLHMKHRLTGDDVKCFVSGDAEREIALREIGDVWRKQRISVFGVIHFKAPGRISQVDASNVRFLRTRSELPDVEDIIDPDFTRGMRSEDYIEKLRDGEVT